MVLEESSGETDQDRCSAIVEANNPLRWITEVGDDEAHSGEKFSLVPLYLGHLPPGPVPTLGLVSKVVVAHNGPSGWPFHRKALSASPTPHWKEAGWHHLCPLLPGTRTPLAWQRQHPPGTGAASPYITSLIPQVLNANSGLNRPLASPETLTHGYAVGPRHGVEDLMPFLSQSIAYPSVVRSGNSKHPLHGKILAPVR